MTESPLGWSFIKSALLVAWDFQCMIKPPKSTNQLLNGWVTLLIGMFATLQIAVGSPLVFLYSGYLWTNPVRHGPTQLGQTPLALGMRRFCATGFGLHRKALLHLTRSVGMLQSGCGHPNVG